MKLIHIMIAPEDDPVRKPRRPRERGKLLIQITASEPLPTSAPPNHQRQASHSISAEGMSSSEIPRVSEPPDGQVQRVRKRDKFTARLFRCRSLSPLPSSSSSRPATRLSRYSNTLSVHGHSLSPQHQPEIPSPQPTLQDAPSSASINITNATTSKAPSVVSVVSSGDTRKPTAAQASTEDWDSKKKRLWEQGLEKARQSP